MQNCSFFTMIRKTHLGKHLHIGSYGKILEFRITACLEPGKQKLLELKFVISVENINWQLNILNYFSIQVYDYNYYFKQLMKFKSQNAQNIHFALLSVVKHRFANAGFGQYRLTLTQMG
jgi:hypothetical protein